MDLYCYMDFVFAGLDQRDILYRVNNYARV